MPRVVASRYLAVFAAVVGLALLVVGVVYLTVECRDLPGFLGPTQGDTSPRTALGVIGVVLGVVLLVAAFAATRRRSPNASSS